MSIHTVGDSHSVNGWENCDNIISHYMGSMLCYSFARDKLSRCNIKNYNMKDGDTVIFCFGEIDCRCHIHKYINDKNDYKNIIDNLVYNYIETIKLNINNSGIIFKNICVYNIVPPIKKETVWENPEFPYLGTDEERKNYVLYFNQKVKEYCINNNYIYFDIYDCYCDIDGYLRKDLSDDNVHIKDPIYINDFIKNNLIL